MEVGKWTAHKTQAALLARLPVRKSDFRRYTALDFGESCGLAFCDMLPGQAIKDVPVYLDLLDLSIGTFASSGVRFLRLEAVLEAIDPSVLFFEDVKYTPSMDLLTGKPSVAKILARSAGTTEFFGALKHYAVTWAERNNIPCTGYGIGEIKKFATGKGNASKSDMIEACNKALGTKFDSKTYEQTGADDICDAAFCLMMGAQNYQPA